MKSRGPTALGESWVVGHLLGLATHCFSHLCLYLCTHFHIKYSSSFQTTDFNRDGLEHFLLCCGGVYRNFISLIIEGVDYVAVGKANFRTIEHIQLQEAYLVWQKLLHHDSFHSLMILLYFLSQYNSACHFTFYLCHIQ